MLQSIEFRRVTTRELAAGRLSKILVRDTCYGIFVYEKIRNLDIYAAFILYTIISYESRKLAVSGNLLRCLRIIREQGIDLYYTLENVEVHWNKICPQLDRAKYLTLIRDLIKNKV